MRPFCLGLIAFILSYSVHAQKLIILHTNDHHGQFMANTRGEFGLAQQSTLINQIRNEAAKEGAHVLILSAGDINTGAPESNMFRARPDIEAMNKMGYEAMVLGNHEFDIPLNALREQEKLAKFPFLAANIKNADGSDAFRPYITKVVGGKKIAIMGVTTLETPAMSAEINRPGLVWQNPLEAQGVLVKQLKKDHDMVIALSHMGYYPGEAPGIKFPGDEGLAKSIPELDLIIGGHTHSELHTPVMIGNTPIVQAKSEGQFVGKIEVDLSGSSPKISKYSLIPVKGFKPDPSITKIIDPYLAQANEKLQRKIGTAIDELKGGREAVKIPDSPLANFLAESNGAAVGADVSFVHARGIRASLPKGDITARDILSVSPFGNTITTAELNGEEVWKLMEILNEKYIQMPNENTFFNKNVELEITDKNITKIFVNGHEVPRSPTGKFKIATSNFYTEMVPDFNFIKEHPSFKNSGIPEVDAMENFLKKSPTVDPQSFKHLPVKPARCAEGLRQVIQSL